MRRSKGHFSRKEEEEGFHPLHLVFRLHPPKVDGRIVKREAEEIPNGIDALEELSPLVMPDGRE